MIPAHVLKSSSYTSCSRRICTAAEVTYYFNSFLQSSGPKSFIRPNLNCNLTSLIAGCEPGWACSVPKDQKVNLKVDKNTPVRNLNCRACCEGFFCPEGLTCMTPCPLGSYCPAATLNKTTDLCEPYNYQLPPGQPNHTCGGADKWADVLSSRDVFCPAGFYCPNTIKKISCSSGYCIYQSFTMTCSVAATYSFPHAADFTFPYREKPSPCIINFAILETEKGFSFFIKFVCT